MKSIIMADIDAARTGRYYESMEYADRLLTYFASVHYGGKSPASVCKAADALYFKSSGG